MKRCENGSARLEDGFVPVFKNICERVFLEKQGFRDFRFLIDRFDILDESHSILKLRWLDDFYDWGGYTIMLQDLVENLSFREMWLKVIMQMRETCSDSMRAYSIIPSKVKDAFSDIILELKKL